MEERPHRKVKLTFSISSCGTKHIPYSNMFDTTYCPRQTCVFPPDRFVQLYYFHFGVCKCTLLNSNWVVLIRKSCGSTHSQIKNPTHIKTSREANHHISIQKHWKDTQIDKLFSFFLLTIEDECSNSMSYVGTKLLPGIAYKHGHWPWVQFINIDTGQADHDCPRRGGGDKNQSLLDVLIPCWNSLNVFSFALPRRYLK